MSKPSGDDTPGNPTPPKLSPDDAAKLIAMQKRLAAPKLIERRHLLCSVVALSIWFGAVVASWIPGNDDDVISGLADRGTRLTIDDEPDDPMRYSCGILRRVSFDNGGASNEVLDYGSPAT